MDLFEGSSLSGSEEQESSTPIEKNFFFIYENDHPQIDLHRYENSRGKKYYGKLFLSITTLQDIFIGSGEIDKHATQLYDVFSYVLTGNGKKIWNIPGSSLKGCIFTNLSMFLSLPLVDFFGSCDRSSKVFFSDLPLTSVTEALPKEIRARFSPKIVPEDAILKLYKRDYKKDAQSQGSYSSEPGMESIQAIRAKNRFEGQLHFKLLDEFQIALLVLALGSFPGNSFNFKIGGAKNRAMGLVRLEIDFEKSFCSHTLRDIADKNVFPLVKFKPNLEKALLQLKQDFPALDPIIKKIQGEYGK